MLVLAIICLWTIYDVLMHPIEIDGTAYKRQFSTANLFAILSVSICIATYFFARRQFKYLSIATVFLGFLGILSFTSTTYTFVFIIPFQPLSAGIALMYLGLNYRLVKSRLEGPEENEADKVPDETQIAKFRTKYMHKTVIELQELIEDKRFVKEAKIAAQKLLNERI